jgi:hypothetical protein
MAEKSGILLNLDTKSGREQLEITSASQRTATLVERGQKIVDKDGGKGDPKSVEGLEKLGHEINYSVNVSSSLEATAHALQQDPNAKGKVFDFMQTGLVADMKVRAIEMTGDELIKQAAAAPRREGITFTHSDFHELTFAEEAALLRVLVSARKYSRKEDKESLTLSDWETGFGLVAEEFRDARDKVAKQHRRFGEQLGK